MPNRKLHCLTVVKCTWSLKGSYLTWVHTWDTLRDLIPFIQFKKREKHHDDFKQLANFWIPVLILKKLNGLFFERREFDDNAWKMLVLLILKCLFIDNTINAPTLTNVSVNISWTKRDFEPKQKHSNLFYTSLQSICTPFTFPQ